MGSNASKSTSAYSVRNYSSILRNGISFKLGDLDVSKRHLLLELRRIILMDLFFIIIILCNYNQNIMLTVAIHGESRAHKSCAFVRGYRVRRNRYD